MSELITKLSDELSKALNSADEVYIAVALLNESGLEFLLDNVDGNCKINLLVGIDLPTALAALKRLFELENINTRIYSGNEYFHPKLYILKGSDFIKTFVGSSNFTNGGLNDNIELSLYLIDENACNDALNWFKKAFNSSKLLSDEFLNEYELLYSDRERQRDNEKKSVVKLKALLSPPPLEEPSLDLLTNDYYFVKEDYLTFHKDKIYKEVDSVENERIIVRDKMVRLENLLYKDIKRKKWKIYEAKANEGVSLIKINSNRPYINSIWLHFGKKGTDKGLGTFIENIRLQVIISGDLRLTGGYGLGVWLMIGKKLGSIEDRAYIKDNIDNPSFQHNFYKRILDLGSGYFIKVNNISQACNILDEITLVELVKADKLENYFIIGRDFEPHDKGLLRGNIVRSIMSEYEKLYPLYQLLKFKCV